jgi:threonine synthase
MVTPQTSHPELAREIGVPALYFKREDLHPLGSHKGRSIPHMIDEQVAQGITHFAISSSGNAALAAVRYIVKLNSTGGHGLTLSILVGKNINPSKKNWLLSEITDSRITLTETERPLQSLLNLIKGTKIASLRQSTDDSALVGYRTLAEELLAIPELSTVFIASSSGTTAQALSEHFLRLKKAVSVFIVQTAETAPLASEFDTSGTSLPKEVSLADAIVDRVAHRKIALSEALTQTGGGAFIAENTYISSAQKLLKEKAGIDATGNGSLSLAGLLKARAAGRTFSGAVACIVTGK